jgi:hypothetical protein
MRACAAALISASLGLGCYNYLPQGRTSLVPSSYLAITLTDFGSEMLAPSLGPRIGIVRGRFLRTTDQGLTLSVWQVETSRGDLLAWQGETVTVPGGFVRDISERRASRSKTTLLAAASLAGFFTLSSAFGPGVRGSASSGAGTGSSSR